MSQTRVVKVTYGEGGFDPSKPNNNIVETAKAEISDGQLGIEAVEAETTKANDNALNAYKNFDKLTLAQKNRVLKGLLGDFISRNKDRYIGVL